MHRFQDSQRHRLREKAMTVRFWRLVALTAALLLLVPCGRALAAPQDEGGGGLRTTDELAKGAQPGEGKEGEEAPKEGAEGEMPPADQGEGMHGDAKGDGYDRNRISDEVIEMAEKNVPPRPVSVLEIGDPFMHPGVIGEGITLPTGAVWQPSFLLYGTYRSGLGYAKRPDSPVTSRTLGEWANRLDLFANFRFSPTERILLGFRPLDEAWDRGGGEFTGYRLHPDSGSTNGFNLKIRTFFFEGDFGEIFPKIDPNDTGLWDFGFSLGRQPFLLQDGLMANGNIEALIVTRNSLRFKNMSNFRASGVLAWNSLHRGNGIEDDTATMIGLLTETDFTHSTVEAEILFVGASSATNDALYLSAGSIQRWGHFNTTGRVLLSLPFDGSNSDRGANAAAATSGALLFVEVSWVPPYTQDNIYANVFLAIDKFSSAIRDPDTGGPLGRVGILFAASGLGALGSPLSNQADDAFGFAVGRQFLLQGGRRQFIVEFAARKDTNNVDQGAFALGGRFQQAIGQRYIVVADAYLGWQEQVDEILGARVEFQVRF